MGCAFSLSEPLDIHSQTKCICKAISMNAIQVHMKKGFQYKRTLFISRIKSIYVTEECADGHQKFF